MLAVPRALFRQRPQHLSFSFQWSDNTLRGALNDTFSLHGDAAPDRRAEYVFDAVDGGSRKIS
jgi:hypothetical protein